MIFLIVIFVNLINANNGYDHNKEKTEASESNCKESLVSAQDETEVSFWSKDPQFILKIRMASATMDSYPWRCSCGRLNGKRHEYCPDCRAHWSSGEYHSNVPKSPRRREETSQWEDWTYWNQKAHSKGKAKGKDRSESARRRAKGKGNGRKGQGRGDQGQHAMQSGATQIPPWPAQDANAATSAQAPIPPAQTAASMANAEWLAAIRKSFPDLSQAPEEIQRAVEKAEKTSSKALSKDLNKASNQVGKAARQLANIKDARASHRQNWLKHLKDSVESWQKQLQVFKDQQKEYGEQMMKAQQELTASRRHLQNLNKQAAATGTPLSTVAGDAPQEPTDLEASAAFEAEAQALVQQVQESLQQSIEAASKENDPMEIPSDEEGDRRTKRPRSMEPFGAPETGLGGGPSISSPRS